MVATRSDSKSNRKGVMTKNKTHQDFSTQEDHDRSGHTGSDINNNSERYVESTPAMNASVSLAVTGYLECHTRVCSYNFDFLGLEVDNAVI